MNLSRALPLYISERNVIKPVGEMTIKKFIVL